MPRKLFLGYFPSFRPERFPFVAFTRATYADRLLSDSRRGDLLAIVPTKREIPVPGDRCRLAGLAEFGRQILNTTDLMSLRDIPAREWVGGEPRFPKALRVLRAWRFPEVPPVPSVIEEKLLTAPVGLAVQLKSSEAAMLLGFRYESVALPTQVGSAFRRGIDMTDVRSSLTTPSDSHNPSESTSAGFIYAFRYGQHNMWKIGNSYDPNRSLDAMNRNVPRTVTQEAWELGLSRPTSSFTAAKALEYELTRLLGDRLVQREGFACDPNMFEQAWNALIAEQIET
jgi:hypothetical protein